MLEKELIIVNKLGLHARAAAKFVSTSNRYSSSIQIQKQNQGKFVNGKSIMAVMMLAVAFGNKIILKIEGEDEQEAMKALELLILNRFGEDE